MAESDEVEEVVDYYAILNVRKEVKRSHKKPKTENHVSLTISLNAITFQANENELKAAYRRMCMLYHPDKHQDPAKKKVSSFAAVISTTDLLILGVY